MRSCSVWGYLVKTKQGSQPDRVLMTKVMTCHDAAYAVKSAIGCCTCGHMAESVCRRFMQALILLCLIQFFEFGLADSDTG